MFRKHKHHVQLLKKLEDILLGLQIVLSDAENMQASNRRVSQWFNKLQNAVDAAENLIEEVNYEAMRLKVEGQHQNLAEISNQQVSDLNVFLSDDFFVNIKDKLGETIEILEVLEKQIGRLGLKDHFGSTKQETRRPSTSLVDESDIFARQIEIEDLIDRLVSEDANGKKLTVVSIVGMGGVGKTTLAKAVYNDEKVKGHFGLKAWFCVSEAYDAFRITKGLLPEIGSFDLKVDNNLNQLQVKLKESLKGKKFLIVLDYEWNDNYNEWDDLRNVFVQGDIGSKIIVTTRKESVAMMMGNEQISMDTLPIEVSWSLFKRHAFEHMDPMGHPELEEISEMEIGLAVGGAFLSSALNVLFDRLAPQGDLLKMFQKHTKDVRLLKKLRMTLLGLQAVVRDAENKQASNQFVSQWLNELRDAVDSAENLMEEVNYEVLRLKVEGQYQNLAETSNQQVSDLNLCLSDEFFLNIKEKLEDTIETLKELQEQIGLLGLKEHFGSTKQETRRPSTSLVDDSDIFGRHNDIENLIDRLLSEDASGKKLTVVSIVGMGGVGKTTLTKVVYNDERVKNHFCLKAWFCVSESYDAFRITKGLLQEIGSFDLKVDDNLNQLQVKLKESLKGRKFLIVLDDVWNDNYNEWDDLRNVFVQGDIGSKIIVTTRKESVALMMGNEQISMDNLSIEVSWSLFKRHAFENMDPMGHPELEEVGKQIAAKCKGLPLALKTLAGMLRSKLEVEGWKRILRSEIWELPHNDILPALMLSYNDLPAHLKRCFSYCAIFPKAYPFRKEQVIHLWIANGLILQEDKIIQDLGNQYFLELRSRSLFERAPNPSQGNIEKFLMHDLVNDLAQIASSKLCIRLEESQGSRMLERSRHVSYSMGYGDFEKLTSHNKLEQLRTLLPTCINLNYCYYLSKRVQHYILPRLRSLRALSLSRYEIVELPNDLFIKLKLLRFLDLSQTRIEKLPDSICVLYNLETLLLSDCHHLEELPLQMEKLINLRHLDISNTSLLKMPLHLSNLKSLQVLVGAKFLLGGRGGLRMEDLSEVQNLYGSLSVLDLQNVVDRREALKAKMREKNHVEKLSLEWSGSSADNSQTERDILDELHPHRNIKELQITGYRGTKFPNWLADQSFLKLVQLSLSNCKDCDSLPAVGQLPCLKYLSIRGMHRITEVTEEFYGSSSLKNPFMSLEKLEFEDMPEWKQWHALGNGEFPALENLSIENCPKLMGKLPENLCSLIELRISRCPELNLETPKLFTSQHEEMKQIEGLFITDCNSLTSFPFIILPSTLKTIRISRCQKFKLEAPVGEMSYYEMFLEDLILEECDCIDDISPELLPRAHKLSVSRCHNLTRFWIPIATERLYILNCENLEILPVTCGRTQMTYLYIDDCEKLKWLPEHMQELLPSLKKLELCNCPEMESFPEGGLPFNLQQLKIWNCKKLVNGCKEWHLQRLPCLRELFIVHDGSDEDIEHWELPCSIQKLTIGNLRTLSSKVLKSLTSLEYLCIANLPQIQSTLEEGLFSSSSHLTSLRHLQIRNFPNLQLLSESALPSSLSELTIKDCPNLQSLPVKWMPSSLSKLSISNCPLLRPLLEFDKGEYWPNIALIPTIVIDREYL